MLAIFLDHFPAMCRYSSFSFIEGLASNSLIAYYHDFILSLIQLEWVKSYLVTVVDRIVKKY